MAKKFRDLRDSLPAARRKRIEERTASLLRDIALDELRRARELSQEELARELGINQASVSKLERRADMYVSTLRKFVEALGGELEIRANFPGGSVRITQFSEILPAQINRV
jgi:transcriptional regulator with XRE-family HTH domain